MICSLVMRRKCAFFAGQNPETVLILVLVWSEVCLDLPAKMLMSDPKASVGGKR